MWHSEDQPLNWRGDAEKWRLPDSASESPKELLCYTFGGVGVEEVQYLFIVEFHKLGGYLQQGNLRSQSLEIFFMFLLTRL